MDRGRILIAKPGLDGHDRGARYIVRLLRGAGYEVLYTGIRRSPEEIVSTAIREGVDAIGLSVLSGAHRVLFRRVIDLLRERGAGEILVFGGGTIPADDIPYLEEMGARAIFTPGASAESILSTIDRLFAGRAQPGASRPTGAVPVVAATDPDLDHPARGANPMIPEKIRSEAEAWARGPLAEAVAHHPERPGGFETASGLPVDRLYLPDDEIVARHTEKLGFPGGFPFTRGVHPTMYRSRPWTMREYSGYSTAEESNRRYRYLLSEGSTGLSVAFDLPTQIGLDSDDPLAEGEVGKVGVAINTLADMEALFEGIPLDRVSTSMTINAPAAVLLAMYIAAAEGQGVAPAALRGTIQNDILKEYIARGTYIFPPRPSLRLIENTFEYCGRHLPHWNTISISGYHIREAGATAVQEVAFTLADAICYIETALRAGLHVDEFAPRLAFFFAVHSDFFEEVAKFRAARRLYARIMKERFGAVRPESMMLRFHTQTGGVTLAAQQPENNVVRVALQALAAVLGGTQSLHTNGQDEALCLPSEGSVKLAIRTQQVIAHETGVVDTVDPLGGSFYVEHLTDALEAEAEALIRRIDALGGMVAAIEAGLVRRLIDQAADRWSGQVERKERIVVGVNAYADDRPIRMDLFEVGEEVRRREVERLDRVRARRDRGAVDRTLAALRRAAEDERLNLMPPILDAVRAYATVGEICGTLRGVFGEHRQDLDP